MKLWEKIASQFGKPSGVLGRVAGFIMSNRKSNIERNRWAVESLHLDKEDNILEIGFGPGIAIRIKKQLICGW